MEILPALHRRPRDSRRLYNKLHNLIRSASLGPPALTGLHKAGTFMHETSALYFIKK